MYNVLPGASCNYKIVYRATQHLAKTNGRLEEPPVVESAVNNVGRVISTFLFQPTGTQHWRISDIWEDAHTCSDKGYFVSSEDCANSPETYTQKAPRIWGGGGPDGLLELAVGILLDVGIARYGCARRSCTRWVLQP